MEKQHYIKRDVQKKQITCEGIWTLAHLVDIQRELASMTWPTSGTIEVNGKLISHMDTAGAWQLSRTFIELEKSGLTIVLSEFPPQCEKLLSLVKEQETTQQPLPPEKPSGTLSRIGMATMESLQEGYEFLSFTGKLTFEALQMLMHPARLRWRSIAAAIQTTGYQALPIIALLSFMIGVVISYQMGNQLRSYGANIFIVNLLGLSVLREFGPLLTAIMVAGRTGSAFTAQLGIMKLEQEIDALNTMGVTSGELLLLPRIVGLVIALPLLTVWADIFGVIGGMVMAYSLLGVSWHDFLLRFQQVIPLKTLFIGLCKAPIFALLISSIGCFQGMEVRGSAESIGLRTTRSVVLAIFFIIVTDAIFSVLFSKFNL